MLDVHNGGNIEGIAELKQSILNIITTPIGSRVYRRNYGSALFELIDKPQNEATKIRMYAAIADSLARWEPRLRLNNVQITFNKGKTLIDIEGEYLGNNILLEGLQIE